MKEIFDKIFRLIRNLGIHDYVFDEDYDCTFFYFNINGFRIFLNIFNDNNSISTTLTISGKSEKYVIEDSIDECLLEIQKIALRKYCY